MTTVQQPTTMSPRNVSSTTTPFVTTQSPTTTPRNVSSTSSPYSFNFSDPTELKILQTNTLNRNSDLQFRINGNITNSQLQNMEELIKDLL